VDLLLAECRIEEAGWDWEPGSWDAVGHGL
jgi:hypothetical protein